MPWIHKVNAVLESYLAGEGVGQAQVNLLFGKANPCGKLAETFPLKLEHNPSYTNFALDDQKIVYHEGVYVGYRWYDTRKMDVLFPFGHGLSYTDFKYSNMRLGSGCRELPDGSLPMTDKDTIEVLVDVTNTGAMAGSEIVQLYVSDQTGLAQRPDQELKGFEKVWLESGQTKTVSVTLDFRAFAWYNEIMKDWFVGSGAYEIKIGSSSRDIRLTKNIRISSGQALPFEINEDTILEKFMDHSQAKAVVMERMAPFFAQFPVENDPMAMTISRELPLEEGCRDL